MWLSLKVNTPLGLALVNRQVISPPWGDPNSQLKITTTTLLLETVERISDHSVSLLYEVQSFKTTLDAKGDIRAPESWFNPPHILDRRFRITLNPTGAMITLGNPQNLPEPALNRLTSLGEDLRSCWVMPPPSTSPGDGWSNTATPTAPGLQRAGKGKVISNYRLVSKTKERAQIEGLFTVSMESPERWKKTTSGSLSVSLTRHQGIEKATRISQLGTRRSTVIPSQRSELLLQRY